MGHIVDGEIVDLLEGRPDPLRRGRRLVRDMHADQTDLDLPLHRLAVGALIHDIGVLDEEAGQIVLARHHDLPGKLQLEGAAPILGLLTPGHRYLGPGFGKDDLAVDVVELVVAEITHLIGIDENLVKDEIPVLIDQRTAEGLRNIAAQIGGIELAHRGDHAEKAGRARIYGRSGIEAEGRQPLAHRQRRVTGQDELAHRGRLGAGAARRRRPGKSCCPRAIASNGGGRNSCPRDWARAGPGCSSANSAPRTSATR